MLTGNKDTINRVDDGLYPFYVRSPKVERINSYTYDGEALVISVIRWNKMMREKYFIM